MKPEACNATDKNACSGDSGGGIISRFLDDNRDHRYFLLGMTSFGSDCIHLSAGNEARAQIYTGIINQHHDDISSFIGL
uniref:Peptidase S1 domain-containing protein n=1 Tax=Ditylenchus dipsaci TaxID=166011 RepID=A0A915DCK3_9BILA